MSEYRPWLEIVVFVLFIVLFVVGMVFLLKRSMEWIEDEVDDE